MGTHKLNFVKGQRNQWLGRILKRELNDPLRVAFEWKPQRKHSRGCPRERWIDWLKAMGMEDWQEIVQDG